MHFERSLRRTIYPPWKDQYIDYSKLKRLLRDEGSEAGSVAGHNDEEDKWTEEDEGAFVEELVNVQLEKVHSFQAETIKALRERTSACESKLDPLAKKSGDGNEEVTGSGIAIAKEDAETQQILREVETELDKITKEMNELEKYSRINYTGFLKATKKHDRKRGSAYRVRPLMQVRLSHLPFNKEDYDPLLFRLSAMYNFVRQNLGGRSKAGSVSGSHIGEDGHEFTSFKFWVHQDNILELKTNILRRLPVLVYNPQTSKIVDGGKNDPTITSIYFDNPKFSLYDHKVNSADTASSLRLRWYGQLSEGPEIYCEKKVVNNEDDTSSEQKLVTKPKYVQRFLKGEYKMDKDYQRRKEMFGEDSHQAATFRQTVDDIQEFIKTNDLQPLLRANYQRNAFQIPGDSRVRITLDNNIAFIREDAIDTDRPIRDPADWHRREIDDQDMEWPFEQIRRGEVNRFPHAILEIRIRGEKHYEWVSDLMSSHLVKPAPKFSKFVQGVAQLFDDYVNTFPFWLSEVDTDIRRDPHQAFEEEQARREKARDDEFAVGSLLKHRSSLGFRGGFRSPQLGSPLGSTRSQGKTDYLSKSQQERATADMTRHTPITPASAGKAAEDSDSDSDAAADADTARSGFNFRSLVPSALGMSKYAQARRLGHVKLPPGISAPTFWLKDEGEVKVEAKVWLANQRTYIKWQHVSILLASLSLGLYNAAGKDNDVARALAIAYTIIALFIAAWGYGIYMWRSNMIRKRSGRDFDNVIGPVVVCVGLSVALVLNFAFKYQATIEGRNPNAGEGRGGDHHHHNHSKSVWSDDL